MVKCSALRFVVPALAGFLECRNPNAGPAKAGTTSGAPLRLALLALVAFTLVGRAASPEYKLGDTAREDVITPVPLSVLDAEGTETLKKREATRVPMVFRFDPRVADEVETAFRAAFNAAHTNFDDALYRTMKGKPESERTIGGPLFEQAVESAKRRADGFPLLDQLAPIWARNDSDEPIQLILVRQLREVMSQPVIAGRVEGYNSKNSIRLVAMDSFEQPLSPQDAEERGQLARGDQVILLSQAHKDVQTNIFSQLKVAGRYVAGFVRTNAMADVELTRLMRAKRTDGLAVMDHYQAAQTVVRKGQLIDAKALAALAMLREKSAIGTLQTKLAVTEAAKPQPLPPPEQPYLVWIAAGFAVVVILLLLILRRVPSRDSNSMLPVLARNDANYSAVEGEWRERALAAEAAAEQAKLAMKSGFMEWMRQRLVHGLFHQRKQLLSSQQKAEAEMRALDERLEQLHAPLQERIATYERRIAELEKDLAVKGEENRELIKAKITLAKLSVERERSRAGFGTN